MKNIYKIAGRALQNDYSLAPLHFASFENAIKFCEVEAEREQKDERETIVISQGEDDNSAFIDLRDPAGWNIISWTVTKLPLF